MRAPCRFTICLVAVFISMSAGSAGALERIELTSIDTSISTIYGTFQSHNQKVVSNDNGIFLTYVDTFDPSLWRLMRSTDGGASFTTVYEATNYTSPPAVETDAAGNVFLAHPDWTWPTGDFYFYKFAADSNYTSHTKYTYSNAASAGKHAMTYDPARDQFYIGTQYGKILTVGTDGSLRSNTQVVKFEGPNAYMQYPQLKMDAAGNLHYGWTTSMKDVYGYWDIHHLQSPDGGSTWQNIDGTAIDISGGGVIPDNTGPATMVSLADEYTANTWLANMLPKDGKLHMFYQAQSPVNRTHYVRYDIDSGAKDVDTGSTFAGEVISVYQYDGFFATDRRYPNTPLYAIARDTYNYLACLASDDNGETWYDYARTDIQLPYTYAVGGASQITDDGDIIGTFTDYSAYDVFFFRIPTILDIPHDGDADNDGDVDIFDYMTMTASYGRPGTSHWRWVEGDFDEDGDIDIFDYMAMTAEYGWTEGGSSGENIPEPVTVVLLAIGGIFGTMRGRRVKIGV